HFSKGVSRKHCEIELTAEGILITDTSTHNTSIEGVRKQPAAIRHSGALAVRQARPELITEVPKTPKDHENLALRKEADRSKRVELEVAAIDEKMTKLSEGLSESDKSNLWKYAAGQI